MENEVRVEKVTGEAIIKVTKNHASVRIKSTNKSSCLNIYNALSNAIIEQLLENGVSYDEAVGMLINAATAGFETAYSNFKEGENE